MIVAADTSGRNLAGKPMHRNLPAGLVLKKTGAQQVLRQAYRHYAAECCGLHRRFLCFGNEAFKEGVRAWPRAGCRLVAVRACAMPAPVAGLFPIADRPSVGSGLAQGVLAVAGSRFFAGGIIVLAGYICAAPSVRNWKLPRQSWRR